MTAEQIAEIIADEFARQIKEQGKDPEIIDNLGDGECLWFCNGEPFAFNLVECAEKILEAIEK